MFNIFYKKKGEIMENAKNKEVNEYQEQEEKKPIYFQKILFGSPGTGKSYQILDENNENSIINQLNLKKENIFRTIFHPEHKYGDFIGKLLPHTENGNITYKFYAGEFLKALAQAYKNILDNPDNPDHVLLIIDEINRGNSSAIFGKIFQLLDRDNKGWSEYEIMISDLEFESLLKSMGEIEELKDNQFGRDNIIDKDLTKKIEEKLNFLLRKEIKLPQNLSIVATMNTSDESIFYMDSAFKRRWDWEYVPTVIDNEYQYVIDYENNKEWWDEFYPKLNRFILDHSEYIRKVEDKLIGEYFLKDYSKKTIQNKLIFFLWDTVFQRDKTPLSKLLDKNLQTFGNFTQEVYKFIEKISEYNPNKEE